MSLLSVIVPARNETFIKQTVDGIFKAAEGDIEIIVMLDGYEFDPKLDDRDNLTIVTREARGMRAAINGGVALAKGDHIMKCDAHCLFEQGFDKKLEADCDENWVVIPSRYSLDAENWAIEQNGKPRRDYHYLCYPDPNKGHDGGMHGVEWWDRGKERLDPKYDIDDTPSFQGSCWYMHKSWFDNFLHGMSEVGYGTFSQEPQEIGMKTWLGGGRLVTNKKTYYCHLHKGKRYGRMYKADFGIVEAHNWSAHHWVFNEEPNMIHKFDWFINEKFPGMPTWPIDWKERLGI